MSDYLSARHAFTAALLREAEMDRRIFALATDSRGSVALDAFAGRLPEQFVECGIAEQDCVGIAAGLSTAGLLPYVCAPACFLTARAVEQIKADVGYAHQNVKLLGVSGGVSYGALGATHHAVQDIAVMRAILNMQVILPADANQAAACVRALLKSGEPAYIRLGRAACPDVYAKDDAFEIGRANALRRGEGLTIIACGEMVAPALAAGDALNAAVLDMHTVAPLDEDALMRAAAAGRILTVEEHDVRGGLGSAVAEFVSQRAPTRMRIMGLPHETLYAGTAAEVKDCYGLNEAGIIRAAKELMSA